MPLQSINQVAAPVMFPFISQRLNKVKHAWLKVRGPKKKKKKHVFASAQNKV